MDVPLVPASFSSAPLVARRVRITGVVQGVGFRPFVHRVATREGVCGWVRNDGGAVEILVEGGADAVDGFLAALHNAPPPLARIDAVAVTVVTPGAAVGFTILASTDAPQERLPVAPDVVTCDACLAELHDPVNRRHHYPFTTCTDCGPRYTVIEALPYDRARTSLAAFPQCATCRAEYERPGDRRFHSESNACPACGPRLWAAIVQEGVARELAGNPIDVAVAALHRGETVALRGLGGFHLVCDATDEAAVQRLRERKHREAKPLAVMVASLGAVEALAEPTLLERSALASRARPIVLLARRTDGPLAPSVAPGLARVGVMLAYTPTHHLLLEAMQRPLVMTSGNLSDEPIAAGNAEGIARLAPLADLFLLHDREIVARIDDSVVRVAAGAPLLMRRARGFAPLPLSLAQPLDAPILAMGAHLKHTFALGVGRTAYVSPHIGDLESIETLEHFRAVRARFEALFRLTPTGVVCDRHAGYLSSQEATSCGLPILARVQHHHAHMAAVLGEYDITERAIGVAFDGTGAGDDGTVWGGEFLVGDARAYARAAHLAAAPLPGGDAAVRRPWRVAMGYGALDHQLRELVALRTALVPMRERDVVAQQLRSRVNAPMASSMGRLFDAAAAVIGVRQVAHYEGQAAMEVEALADGEGMRLPFPVESREGRLVLNPVPLLVALAEGAQRGVDHRALAAAFHASVIATTAEVVRTLADTHDTRIVTLSGGCFQNVRLLGGLVEALTADGLRVLVPRLLPPNDGAISYGQLVVAAAQAQGG